MAWVVLAKEKRPGAIEVRSPIEVEDKHVPWMAQVAYKEGFHLMWEFSERPNEREIVRRVPKGQVSGMRSMRKLWVLSKAHLE